TPAAARRARARSSPTTGTSRSRRGVASASSRPTRTASGAASRSNSMTTLAWPPAPSTTTLEELGDSLGPDPREVRLHHLRDHVFNARDRLPSQHAPGLGRIADEPVDLGGAEEGLVGDHVVFHGEADATERHLAHGADRGGPPRGDHIVIGGVLLEHEPHGADVVLGVAPV